MAWKGAMGQKVQDPRTLHKQCTPLAESQLPGAGPPGLKHVASLGRTLAAGGVGGASLSSGGKDRVAKNRPVINAL